MMTKSKYDIGQVIWTQEFLERNYWDCVYDVFHHNVKVLIENLIEAKSFRFSAVN